MQPIEKNPVLQLLQIRGDVLAALSSFPCGSLVDHTCSAEEIDERLRPVVTGLPDYVAALDLGLKTLAEICRFGSTERPDSNVVLAEAIAAFLDFQEKERALCPVNVH